MTLPKRVLTHAVIFVSLLPSVASSEKADREKEMDISSKYGLYEGSKETNVKKLEGDVLIERGTMRITAERAIVKETAEGTFAELFGKSSGPITFRQKREGENDFVEASADHAEYVHDRGCCQRNIDCRWRWRWCSDFCVLDQRRWRVRVHQQ